jgi:hypothetical protein
MSSIDVITEALYPGQYQLRHTLFPSHIIKLSFPYAFPSGVRERERERDLAAAIPWPNS